MFTAKSKDLFEFIASNYLLLKKDCSSGGEIIKSEFELFPRDYIDFAKENLLDTTIAKINCVSFLKRAIDCQTDYFLNSLGLMKVIKKSNLGVEKKLKFISEIGIFDQQSLVKLNNIRNKMEHDYSIPNIHDIEVYYDLCLAYISNMEAAMIVLMWREHSYFIEKGKVDSIRFFDISIISDENPRIEYSIDRKNTVIIPATNFCDYTFAFRCYYMLSVRNAYSNKGYYFKRIEEYYKNN